MTWRDRVGFSRTSGQGTTPVMATTSPLFCFFSSSSVCTRLAAPFLSVDFLVFRSQLSPSCRRLATILNTSFSSKTDSYPPSGLEGLCHNIAAIGSTPPPPTAGSSLGRALVLSQGMGEGLSSKFSGQASGKRSVCFSRLRIVANNRGLQGGFGGRHCHVTPRGTWR